jgi:hypothetical protein
MHQRWLRKFCFLGHFCIPFSIWGAIMSAFDNKRRSTGEAVTNVAHRALDRSP